MACEFDSLGHTWIVHGKPVTPMFDEDVIELIRDNVCDDCAEYVRERFDSALSELLAETTDEDILNGICSGECRKVQEAGEHYVSILHEIKDIASKVYHQIVDDWKPGTRRTKKEQFAVDKVNEIMRKVDMNT